MWHLNDLEPIPCDLCGPSGQSKVVLSRPDGLVVVECGRCGLAYVSPRPKPDCIRRLYDQSYFSGDREGNGIGYDCNYFSDVGASIPTPLRKMFARQYARSAIRTLRVLEVGCATGNTLSYFKHAGAQTLGIELSAEAARLARERHGLDVIEGSVERIALPAAHFDVVLALEVIEHMLSPLTFLRQCAAALRVGGCLFLSTPNYGAGQRLGSAWLGFQSSFEHLYFFNTQSLSELAKQCGLQVASTAYDGGNPKRRLSPLRRYCVAHVRGAFRATQLMDFISHACRRRWGTSHGLWTTLKRV
jgi:SAM-dependent methyltransferase